MFVGAKAIATLSAGYQVALDYAKTRVQGADLTATSKDAPRVTITHHPDVRRSLMLQKAYAEGMRALYLYTASFRDQVTEAEAAGERGQRAGEAGRAGQRPAAADREGLRLRAGHPAAHRRVAADPGRLGLPAGLPDRAVHPGLQDRHPLRGHHGDPGPGLLLPEDRQGRRRRADLAGRARSRPRSTPRSGNGRLKEERALLAAALSRRPGHAHRDVRPPDRARRRT